MDMQIIVKVNGVDPNLIVQLMDRGITCNIKTGVGFVALPFSDEDTAFRVIPEIQAMENVKFMIHVAECGGKKPDGCGTATIVCGVKGGALVPYHIPIAGKLIGRDHALFMVEDSVVTIITDHPSGTIWIKQHKITPEGECRAVYSREIWSGSLDDLPESLAHYEAAARAAVNKAGCLDCKNPHYYIKSVNGN